MKEDEDKVEGCQRAQRAGQTAPSQRAERAGSATVAEVFKNLPSCSQRLGRYWDDIDGIYRAVLTCGGVREVGSDECISCGGHKVMLKNEVSGFGKDDYKVLKCELNNKFKNKLSNEYR